MTQRSRHWIATLCFGGGLLCLAAGCGQTKTPERQNASGIPPLRQERTADAPSETTEPALFIPLVAAPRDEQPASPASADLPLPPPTSTPPDPLREPGLFPAASDPDLTAPAVESTLTAEATLRIEAPEPPPPDSTSRDEVVDLPPVPKNLQPVVKEAALQTVLPWAGKPALGKEIEPARRQTDDSLRHGFELAERGALYSARTEFTQALRQLAVAIDQAQGTSLHTTALAGGIRALREMEDFAPRAGRVETALPLEVLISAHQTSVLKRQTLAGMSAATAAERYQSVAEEQLALAVEHEPLGSLALYALGKIQAVIDAGRPTDIVARSAASITYHKAALLAEPLNFLASNDLGVLLAKQGRWEEARGVLESSLAVSTQVVTLQNLAFVQHSLGQPQLALQVRAQSEQLAAQQRAAGHNEHRMAWLEATDFARTSSAVAGDPAVPTKAAPKPVAKSENESKSSVSWLPWLSPQKK